MSPIGPINCLWLSQSTKPSPAWPAAICCAQGPFGGSWPFSGSSTSALTGAGLGSPLARRAPRSAPASSRSSTRQTALASKCGTCHGARAGRWGPSVRSPPRGCPARRRLRGRPGADRRRRLWSEPAGSTSRRWDRMRWWAFGDPGERPSQVNGGHKRGMRLYRPAGDTSVAGPRRCVPALVLNGLRLQLRFWRSAPCCYVT